MNIVLLTNILTPYRMALFKELESQLVSEGGTLRVLAMADTEPNRSWQYDDLSTDATTLLHHITIPLGGAYVHLCQGLTEALQSANPDVVICAGSYLSPAVWQVMLLRHMKSHDYATVFWSESHANEVHGRSRPTRLLRGLIRRAVLPRFDGFLYPGEMSLQFIERYNSPSAINLFFPNTVDDPFFNQARESMAPRRQELRASYGVGADSFVFVTPSRLTSVKGLDKMLGLAANIERLSEVTFLVAGSGEQEALLRAMSEDLGVDLRLMGEVSRHEIAELYALADCMLLPSIADPNPLAVVEALWSGLPLLLSSHVGNHPEAVKSGLNGYVFDYQEPKVATELFDQMIASDVSWRASASAASLAIAREVFDSRKVVRHLLRELSKVRDGIK